MTVRPMVVGWIILALVAACASPAAAPTSAPQATLPGPTRTVYTDAQKTALAAENIDVVYCADPPRPDWCKALVREGDKPVVLVENTSLFITTNLNNGATAKETAAEMCADIAAAPYDDNAELIGWLHVHVGSRTHEELADCDVVY